MIAVVVTDKEGTEGHFEAVKTPHSFGRFLVIDEGTATLLYIPLENVSHFTADKVLTSN